MRLVALLILVTKFEKTKDEKEKKTLVDFYLKNTKYINNWDLVDLSCYKLLGRYCFENQKDDILKNLSNSETCGKNASPLWLRCIISKRSHDLTIELALNNLNHSHDLMHKANGWLLREMGKKMKKKLLNFLKTHYQNMPRTSLRYAIEKLDEDLRQDF